jgi:hypothetical protein
VLSVQLLASIVEMLLTGSCVFSPLTPVLYVTETFTLSAGNMKLSFDLLSSGLGTWAWMTLSGLFTAEFYWQYFEGSISKLRFLFPLTLFLRPSPHPPFRMLISESSKYSEVLVYSTVDYNS